MDLSIVIPTLNEEQNLASLLEGLAAQRGVESEAVQIIVADGGSADDTRGVFDRCRSDFDLDLIWVKAPPGRGSQLNAGAAMAEHRELLFLHADTRLEDEGLLKRASAFMEAALEKSRDGQLAGHFGLTFDRASENSKKSAAYYFYEAKTKLDRAETVNGDQGMWLSRAWFEELGGFDESLPFMEDARLALKVGHLGRWVNLPGTLTTSARRFETEGLARRQVLNSFLRCFDVIGFRRYFKEAREAYREQSEGELLDLRPFLALAHRLALEKGVSAYLGWWYKTGAYVRPNAWQLAFALECGINRRRGLAPGEGDEGLTKAFELTFNLLTGNPVGNLLAGLLTHATFHLLWGALALKHLIRKEEQRVP